MLSAVRGQGNALPFLRRLAEGKAISPLLLVGEEGTGKRFASIQLAKEMLCQESKVENCPCANCYQIDKAVHPDILILSPEDGKEIGIAPVREMIEQALLNPLMGSVRFFIVDGVDRMTMPAANAILKTLEEPHHTTRFLLLAELKTKVIPTIRSRCGEVIFERLTEDLVMAGLQRFEKDDAKALVYARMAEGSLGRAIRLWGSGSLRLRDQVLSLIELGLTGDVSPLFSQVDSMSQSLPFALRLMAHATHDIAMIRVDPTRIYNVDAHERVATIARTINVDAFHRFRAGLNTLLLRQERTRINLPFHVKTLFIDAFQGS